jgi:FkbM family methyltransferase
MQGILAKLSRTFGRRRSPEKFRFYGQFDPPLDQVLYERFFRGRRKPGIFVESGAFDGLTECTCKFFEESLEWSGVNIEPSPPIFSKLEKNRPRSRNLNAALASTDGYATFHGIVHPEFGEQCTNGSLRHHPTHAEYIAAQSWPTKDYTVPTITWGTMIAANGLNQVDLLVLDVEGTELEVIEGMRGSDVLPGIFCIEHGHLGVPAVRGAVESLGYRYAGGAEVNSFFQRGQ